MKWWLERVPKEKLVLSWAGLVFIQKYFLRTEKPAALNKCFKEMKSKIASKLFFKDKQVLRSYPCLFSVPP